ncbi:hypothetical protein [Streptomyces abyssomicinicus]|uniref:hypothetical protein n=1 Tax=Streptomyces abyssomicinicus TaxID=574929 RepID=UPI00124FCA57|nr:hypothetical protein [Streptomyces abyssomicinicus]
MNRIASRSTLSSRRLARVGAALLTAGLLAGLGQGTALAADAPQHTAASSANLPVEGAAALDHLLGKLDGLLPDVLAPLSKNNNDWQ